MPETNIPKAGNLLSDLTGAGLIQTSAKLFRSLMVKSKASYQSRREEF
jgi:hypothetical protein